MGLITEENFSTSPTGVPQLLKHQLLKRIVHIEVPFHLELEQVRLGDSSQSPPVYISTQNSCIKGL